MPELHRSSINGYATTQMLIVAWLLSLTVAVWSALETMSAVVWGVSALVVLVPALALMVFAHTPAKTVAEIIRDAEARS